MERVYETSEADLQMHNFIQEECMKLNLHLLGTQFFGCIGNMDLKVFLYRHNNISFIVKIERLKEKCQEIIDTYKHIDIKISFFSTDLEANIEYEGFSKDLLIIGEQEEYKEGDNAKSK